MAVTKKLILCVLVAGLSITPWLLVAVRWLPAATPRNCPVLKFKPSTSGCNSAGECYYDFIQPESWGTCAQLPDDTLICLNQGKITHYSDNGRKIATWKETTCPAIAEQIKKEGQPSTVPLIIIPIPSSPPAPKEPKT